MSEIYIEVSHADLKRVLKKLGDMEKARKHIKNAINRTATKAKKMLSEGARQSYTVKSKKFNQDIRIQKATAAHLDSTLRASGRPRTIMSFKTSAPKSGGKADIVKSGLKPLRGSEGGAAFILKGGPGAGLMAQRKHRTRYPIKIFYANSVPKMIEKVWQGERGARDIQKAVSEMLHDEIMKEIEGIM